MLQKGDAIPLNFQIAKEKRSKILSWAINLGGLFIFLLILYLGGVDVWVQLLQANFWYILAILAVTILWNVVATYRWSIIADRITQDIYHVPFRYYFAYQMIGIVTGQIVPVTLGMLGGRAVALTLSKGVPLRYSLLSTFIDKLFDLGLALLLAIPVALGLAGWISLTYTLMIMGLIAVFVIAFLAWRFEWGMSLIGSFGIQAAQPLGRVPLVGRRLANRIPQRIEELSVATILSNRGSVMLFLLTLLMYVLLSVRLVLIASALQLNIPWYVMAMGVPITQLSLIFSITPGSLGFLEGGWLAVFSLAGMTIDQFTFFVIARRAYVLVAAVLGTLLAFVWIRESPAGLFRSVVATSRDRTEIESTDQQTQKNQSV